MNKVIFYIGLVMSLAGIVLIEDRIIGTTVFIIGLGLAVNFGRKVN